MTGICIAGLSKRFRPTQQPMPYGETTQVMGQSLGKYGLHSRNSRAGQPTRGKDTIHSDGPDPRFGTAKPRGGANLRSHRHGNQVFTATYPRCRQIPKGTNPDVAKRGFLHDGSKQQKGMDMLSERIKRKLHRIFFERCGANQHPCQEFCGMPRSTGILVA